jgi:hypothetical protein
MHSCKFARARPSLCCQPTKLSFCNRCNFKLTEPLPPTTPRSARCSGWWRPAGRRLSARAARRRPRRRWTTPCGHGWPRCRTTGACLGVEGWCGQFGGAQPCGDPSPRRPEGVPVHGASNPTGLAGASCAGAATSWSLRWRASCATTPAHWRSSRSGSAPSASCPGKRRRRSARWPTSTLRLTR